MIGTLIRHLFLGEKWVVLWRGLSLLILLLLMISHCAKKQNDDEIVAIVGDRIITADEFVRRAEYTIRPPYCKRGSNIEKQIILNSLIAEKLLAFESNDENALVKSPAFQAYIQGRKEQAMRQYLFADEIRGKVAPDDEIFQKAYKLAGRKYHVAYFTGTGRAFKNADIATHSFDAIYKQLGGMGQPPEREVSWQSKESAIVHKALFSEPFSTGQIVGPIELDLDQYILLKVIGWTDEPAVTRSAIQQRTKEVKEALEREKSEILWDDYIFDLMKNKRLDFERNAFEKMVELMRPMYMSHRSQKDKASALNISEQSETPSVPIDSILSEIRKNDGFANQAFFKFDGKTWTIMDFLRAHASHPLVFRKRNINTREFPEQFKFAVVDLMRDQVINQEAYKRKIDQLPAIQAHTNMWADAFIAGYVKHQFLESQDIVMQTSQEYMKQGEKITQLLTMYTDSLFEKYSSKIQINVPVLEKIQLTHIDMVVLNDHVPYLDAVPAFPVLTTKSRLNYGKNLK